MSILTALRSGIATANKVTRGGGLQTTVSYLRKTGSGGAGPTFAAAVPLHALVDFKTTKAKTPEGTVEATRPVLTLLDIAEIVAATSGLGVAVDDVFTLPDGRTGPTLSIGGFVDAGTGHPIATEVVLG